jgi:hypothetical protein
MNQPKNFATVMWDISDLIPHPELVRLRKRLMYLYHNAMPRIIRDTLSLMDLAECAYGALVEGVDVQEVLAMKPEELLAWRVSRP